MEKPQRPAAVADADPALDRRYFLQLTGVEGEQKMAADRGRLCKLNSFPSDGQRYYAGIYLAGGGL